MPATKTPIPAEVDTRRRLIVPISTLRTGNWSSQIRTGGAVTIELMDHEGLLRILPESAYKDTLDKAVVDDPEAAFDVDQYMFVATIDAESARLVLPDRAVRHLFEGRNLLPETAYVVVRPDWVELWSADRTLRELRRSRMRTAEHRPK